MRALLFILVLLFAISCGEDEEPDSDEFSDRYDECCPEGRRGPSGRRGRGKRDDDLDASGRKRAEDRVKKDCDTKIIQNSGSECLFLLSFTKHGETYTTQYKEISNSLQHDGVKASLGRGKWICEDGEWKEIASPICLICPAGPLFSDCLIRLEEEEELWRRWQEAQRFWKGTDIEIDLLL